MSSACKVCSLSSDFSSANRATRWEAASRAWARYSSSQRAISRSFSASDICVPMTASLAHRQVICLAFDDDEDDKVWIELVQSDAIAPKRGDLARRFNDADSASEELLCDGYDLLSVAEGDDLGQRHDI